MAILSERSLTDEKGWLTYKVARGLRLPGSKPDEDLMRTDGVWCCVLQLMNQ